MQASQQDHMFWLSESQWRAAQRVLPNRHSGPDRVDDRRVISGIIHVLSKDLAWRNCPVAYGPHMTVYNRFNRWCGRGLWQKLYQAITGYAGDDLDEASGCHKKRRRRVYGSRKSARAGAPIVDETR